MLNKPFPILNHSTTIIRGGKVRGFHPPPLGFDRFGRSAMLFCDSVSDGDDGAVRRGRAVEVVVEVLEGAIRGLGV